MLFMKGSHGADHWGKSASFFATRSDISYIIRIHEKLRIITINVMWEYEITTNGH